jgi:hypothetical protein
MRADGVRREEQLLGGVAVGGAAGDDSDDAQLGVGEARPSARWALVRDMAANTVFVKEAADAPDVAVRLACRVAVQRLGEAGDGALGT